MVEELQERERYVLDPQLKRHVLDRNEIGKSRADHLALVFLGPESCKVEQHLPPQVVERTCSEPQISAVDAHAVLSSRGIANGAERFVRHRWVGILLADQRVQTWHDVDGR